MEAILTLGTKKMKAMKKVTLIVAATILLAACSEKNTPVVPENGEMVQITVDAKSPGADAKTKVSLNFADNSISWSADGVGDNSIAFKMDNASTYLMTGGTLATTSGLTFTGSVPASATPYQMMMAYPAASNGSKPAPKPQMIDGTQYLLVDFDEDPSTPNVINSSYDLSAEPTITTVSIFDAIEREASKFAPMLTTSFEVNTQTGATELSHLYPIYNVFFINISADTSWPLNDAEKSMEFTGIRVKIHSTDGTTNMFANPTTFPLVEGATQYDDYTILNESGDPTVGKTYNPYKSNPIFGGHSIGGAKTTNASMQIDYNLGRVVTFNDFVGGVEVGGTHSQLLIPVIFPPFVTDGTSGSTKDVLVTLDFVDVNGEGIFERERGGNVFYLNIPSGQVHIGNSYSLLMNLDL